MIPLLASRPGGIAVQVGHVEIDGDALRVVLSALPASDAVLSATVPGLAAGPALLRAVAATAPLYRDGRQASVSVWRDGKRWCATRLDDLSLERRASTPEAALEQLADRLDAERASVCPRCSQAVLTVGHADDCPRRRGQRKATAAQG